MSQPHPIADRVTSRIGHSVLMVDCVKQIFIAVSISTKAVIILREYYLKCIDFASVLFVFKHTQLVSFICLLSFHFSHKGCACPPEFEGDHCEFLRGSVQVEESIEQNNQEESKTSTEDAALAAPATPAETEPAPLIVDVAAIAAPATPAEIEPVAPPNHTKESNESKLPMTNEKPEAPTQHDKTPPIQDQPPSKAAPTQDQLPSNNNAPPVSDNLESVPEKVIPFESISLSNNKESSAETNQLGGSIIALISLTGVALILGLLSYRRMRKRKHRHLENHFVLGDNYKDETPIRVQVLSELEQPNELDEVLGLDARSVEYEDDDDVFTERSECSLEEIELEYPTNEGDEDDEFDEPVQHSDYNPFAHIIGPLMRSGTGDGIV